MIVGTWPEGERLDLFLTFKLLRTGSGDPTCSLDAHAFEKAFWTPDGPCVARFTRVGLEAEGPGAVWLAEHGVRSLKFHDPPWAERPAHPVLRELSREMSGLRMVRIPWLSDLAASAVLQQRVTFGEAVRAYRGLIETYGDMAPGGRLRLPLSREQWLRLSHARIQSFNVDGKRALTLLRVADLSRKLDRLYFGEWEAARSLLHKIPGIGPWTRELLLGYGLGDPDAVQTGDVWLPHTVSHALTGERWGRDDKMLELLQPYAGQRFQVIRWLLARGTVSH